MDLGDYYLNETINSYYRHIYDICKLLEIVNVNDDVNFKALLNEIIKKEVYKSDYENITSALLFEKLSYNEAAIALEKILDSELFD